MTCAAPVTVFLSKNSIKNLPGDGTVFGHIGGLAQPLPELVHAAEALVEETPVLLQPEHGVSAAAKFPGVFPLLQMQN